jgi:hypothetical protein
MSQLTLLASPTPWRPGLRGLAWFIEGGRWASMLVLAVEGDRVRGATNEGIRVLDARALHPRPHSLGGRRG